jgi:hypothetical protein
MTDSVGVKSAGSGGTVEPLAVLLRALALPTGQASRVEGGLSTRLVQQFGASCPKLKAILAEYAEDPQTNREAAGEVLREVGADGDQGIVDQAAEVLKGAEQTQPGITDGLVGQINAAGGKVIVAGRIENVTIYTTAPLDPRERLDRSRMLQRVRRAWIDGFLEDSLHGAALQALGVKEHPEAVPDRWSMVVQQTDRTARTLPSDTSIVQVFVESDRELLILGEPGSGKTTMLLELTKTLLTEAEEQEALPMPIVFPLAPWAAKQLPLADWLVDELNQRYDIPRQIGQRWVTNDRILPVLDGLDEVRIEHRVACVSAINAYRESRAEALSGLVVTSRTADYDALAPRLRLLGAVLIQPLSTQQIDAYLTSAGEQLAGVRAALQADPTLRELAASPLLLSTMTLAYRDAPAKALPTEGTVEERRAQLFATYVDQMFNRRGRETRYSQQQTRHWLCWLATALSRQAQTVFFLEHMQPEWLSTPAMRRWYTLTDRLVGGLLGALLYGLVGLLLYGLMYGPAVGLPHGLIGILAFGLVMAPVGAFFGGVSAASLGHKRGIWPMVYRAAIGGLVVALAGGLSGGLVGVKLYGLVLGLAFALVVALIGALLGVLAGVLAGGPSIEPRHITVVESLRWSGSRALASAAIGLVSGLVLGLGSWLVLGLLGLQVKVGDVPVYGLVFGLAVGLVGGLVFALVGGLAGREVEAKVTPNQGIHRSAGRAILVGLAGVLVGGLIVALPFGLTGGLTGGLVTALADGLLVALPFGLTAGLALGGYACLSHAALRLVLWRVDALPLSTIRFLDYATERVFLRRVGGGYIFVHRLLQEYFATPAAAAASAGLVPPSTDALRAISASTTDRISSSSG